MRFQLSKYSITAIREEGDPKFYGIKNARGESRLLYHIKQALNAEGFDLIKKRMHWDGHLVDDLQQYLRARDRYGEAPHIAIYNAYWQISGAEQDWNEGSVNLLIVRDLYWRQPDCVERMKALAERSEVIEWVPS